MPVRLDLNNLTFQEHWFALEWFALEKEEQLAVLHCCGKLAKMDWDAIYRDKGLRWEPIQSRTGRTGERLYSIRMSGKVRAVGKRSGEFVEFLTLHADHDSTYR
jgi:hypothetical protein